jgi:hypothetical protein
MKGGVGFPAYSLSPAIDSTPPDYKYRHSGSHEGSAYTDLYRSDHSGHQKGRPPQFRAIQIRLQEALD